MFLGLLRGRGIPTIVITSNAQHVVLNDGRRLTYEKQGDPHGQPVLLFHGTPGSRLQRHPDDSVAQGLGVRTITIDRPGYGLSDPKPNRRLLDWPDDVSQLAEALSIDRFAVIGASGDGPFALACAYRFPERITRVGLVSSPAPLDVPGLWQSLVHQQRLMFYLAARAPWAVQVMFGWYGRSVRKMTPGAIRHRMENMVLPLEQPLLDAPGFVDMLLADTLEFARGGPAAVALEFALLARY